MTESRDKELSRALSALTEDASTGYWDRESVMNLNTILNHIDGVWKEGYSAGNLDGYFGNHEEYDKRYGQGAFYR